MLPKQFQNHNAVSHDGSFQAAVLSLSSSNPTSFNRSPITIRGAEVKRCIWWPANKTLSVIQLAVIVWFLICLVSHYVLYFNYMWNVNSKVHEAYVWKFVMSARDQMHSLMLTNCLVCEGDYELSGLSRHLIRFMSHDLL